MWFEPLFIVCAVGKVVSTTATMQAASRQQGQLQCQGCRTILAYPLGAQCVRCPLCTQTTFVNQVHIRCVTCSIQLALPASAQLAQCPRCRTVMTMPRHPAQALPPAQQRLMQQQPSVPPPPPKVVVLIEQPATTGPDGRKIANTAIGTKVEDDGVFW